MINMLMTLVARSNCFHVKRPWQKFLKQCGEGGIKQTNKNPGILKYGAKNRKCVRVKVNFLNSSLIFFFFFARLSFNLSKKIFPLPMHIQLACIFANSDSGLCSLYCVHARSYVVRFTVVTWL